MLENRLTFVLAAVLTSAPLAAQGVTNLGLGGCTPNTILSLVGSTAPGSSLQISQLTFGVGYLHLIVLGFSDPGVVLPSCGCPVHAALDVVLVPSSTVTCLPNHPPFPGCTSVTTTQTMLPLPPGSTGLTFYVQGVAIADPASPGLIAATPCTEIGPGAPFGLSNGYEVAIQ